MAIHRLKTWPECFQPSKRGDKPYEIRFNDRNYQRGDTLILEEFMPCEQCKATGKCKPMADGHDDCPCMYGDTPKGRYTGDQVTRLVEHVLCDPAFGGLQPGWVIMAVRPV